MMYPPEIRQGINQLIHHFRARPHVTSCDHSSVCRGCGTSCSEGGKNGGNLVQDLWPVWKLNEVWIRPMDFDFWYTCAWCTWHNSIQFWRECSKIYCGGKKSIMVSDTLSWKGFLPRSCVSLSLFFVQTWMNCNSSRTPDSLKSYLNVKTCKNSGIL